MPARSAAASRATAAMTATMKPKTLSSMMSPLPMRLAMTPPTTEPRTPRGDCPQQPDPLPAGKQQTGEQADDESGDDESDHEMLLESSCGLRAEDLGDRPMANRTDSVVRDGVLVGARFLEHVQLI